jgi:hypothetical protein
MRLDGMKNNSDRLRDVEEDVRDLKTWHMEWKQDRDEQKHEMKGMRNSIVLSVIMLVITTLVNIFIR